MMSRVCIFAASVAACRDGFCPGSDPAEARTKSGRQKIVENTAAEKKTCRRKTVKQKTGKQKTGKQNAVSNRSVRNPTVKNRTVGNRRRARRPRQNLTGRQQSKPGGESWAESGTLGGIENIDKVPAMA